MAEFNQELLKERLECLDAQRRALFALACAERLFSLYEFYCQERPQRRPSYLGSTLDHLWELAAQGETGHEEPFLSDYETMIPEENSQWHPLDALAEDAVVALAYACACQLQGDSASAMWAAVRSYGAADYVAHTLEGLDYGTPEAESAILNREYVQAEIQRQLRDLRELENATLDAGATGHIVRTFRTRAASEGRTLAALVLGLYKREPGK